MSITHIVLFQFKSEVAAEVVHDVCFSYQKTMTQMNWTINDKQFIMDVNNYPKGLRAYAYSQGQLRPSNLTTALHQIGVWWERQFSGRHPGKFL